MITKNVPRALFVIFVVVFLAIPTWLLHYNLPQRTVITVTGTDSRRAEAALGKSTVSRDVYYINGLDTFNKAVTFSNEDTGWGFPYYYKFNSADINSEVKALTGEKVVVTYYGWRNKLLKKFPNALSVTKYTGRVVRTPWERILILLGYWWIMIIGVFPNAYWYIKKHGPNDILRK